MPVTSIMKGNAKRVVQQMYQDSFEGGRFYPERFFERISEFSLVDELSDLVRQGKEPTKEELLLAQIRAYQTTFSKYPESLPLPDFDSWLRAKKELLRDDKGFYLHANAAYALLCTSGLK